MTEWVPDFAGSFTDTYYLSVILSDLEDLIWHDLAIEVAELDHLRLISYVVWRLETLKLP